MHFTYLVEYDMSW